MNEIVGVDTNWLVASATADHPVHDAVERMWSKQLDAGRRIGLTPRVIAEFVHVVTDARRFRVPCSITQALDFAEKWWESAEVERLFPTDEAVMPALQWMRQFRLGRKRAIERNSPRYCIPTKFAAF
jgi:predicted nucleic acid-binding protein